MIGMLVKHGYSLRNRFKDLWSHHGSVQSRSPTKLPKTKYETNDYNNQQLKRLRMEFESRYGKYSTRKICKR